MTEERMQSIKAPLMQAEVGMNSQELSKRAKEHGLSTMAYKKLGVMKQKAASDVKESSSSFSQFLKKASLSLSMGFWITAFYIPVCWSDAQTWLFGTPDAPSDFVQNVGSDIQSFWPNVVQLMFFTVFANTGTTTQLAWQGMVGTLSADLNWRLMRFIFPHGGECNKFSEEPIAVGLRTTCLEYAGGAFYDSFFWIVWVDLIVVIFLFLSSNSAENTMKFGLSWHVYYMMDFLNPNKKAQSTAVIVTSIFGVVLAVLVTLVPNWYLLFTQGKLTFPQMSTPNLVNSCNELVMKVKAVLRHSTEYMLESPYMTRFERSKKRFSIERCIDEIETLVPQIKSNLECAWWERVYYAWACDLMNYCRDVAHARAFKDFLADNIGTADDILFVIKKAVLSDNHSEYMRMDEKENTKLYEERQGLRPELKALTESLCELLTDITDKFIVVGQEVADEKHELEEMDQRTKHLKKVMFQRRDELLQKYWEQRKGYKKDVDEAWEALRDNLVMYMFGLDCLGREIVTDQNNRLPTAVEMFENIDNTIHRRELCAVMKEEFFNTWGSQVTVDVDGEQVTKFVPWLICLMPTSKYFNAAKASFVFRNCLSLTICFVMGNFLQGNVFTAYNSGMAGTLAVLISHFTGSAFYSNLLRLLGLTLGKVLPIVVMAVVSVSGNTGTLEVVVHLFMVFLYCAFFAHMYYTSPQWAKVGCLVTGFGCYGLVGTMADMWSATQFATQYKELGNVAVAIIVQIMVDTIETAVRKQWPRDIVVRNTEKIGVTMESDGHIIAALEYFFKGKHVKFAYQIEEAKAMMDNQAAFVAECHDKSVIVRGIRTPFKYDLYVKVVDFVIKIIREFEILYAAEHYAKKEEKHLCPKSGAEMWSKGMKETYADDVMVNAVGTFWILQNVLYHDRDGTCTFEEHQKVASKQSLLKDKKGLKGQDDLWEIEPESPQHALVIAIVRRGMVDIKNLLFEIQHLCYSSGAFSLQALEESADSPTSRV